MVNGKGNEIPTDLYDAARHFLIGEFNAPQDSVETDDYSMYEYRSHLVNTACTILGVIPVDKKEETTSVKDEPLLDDEDFEEGEN